MANMHELKDDPPATLAGYLRQIRMNQTDEEGKRISLTAMHQRCGLSVPVLSKLETGRVVDPSGSTIKRVLNGYRLSFDEFARYLPDVK